jgi:hypothetical protein
VGLKWIKVLQQSLLVKNQLKLCWKLVKIILGVGVAGQRHNHFAMDLIVARVCHR